MDKLTLKIGTKQFFVLLAIAIAIFFYTVFGMTGLKLFLGVSLLYILPIYLILDNFELDAAEKIIFSFIIGIGIIPNIVFYASRIFVSLRTSIIITFIILIVAAYASRRYIKHKVYQKRH